MKQLEKICSGIGYKNIDGLSESISNCFDISRTELAGAEQMSRWYDTEMPGVRKLISLYLDEFTSLFAGDGRFRVYASVPCPTVIAAAFNSGGRVRISTAELCAMIVLHGILGAPTASVDYNAGGSCAMLQNRKAYIESGVLPRPDLLWSFGLLCDECCKTDELIHSVNGIKHINSFCAKSYSDTRFWRYEESLRSGISELCAAAEISEPGECGTREKANLAAMLCAGICCTNASVECPPLKAATVSLIQTSQLMAFEDIDMLIDALTGIRNDMRRAKRPERKTKIYSYYIPPCVPELGAIFEDNGLHLAGSAAFITRPVQYTHSTNLAGAAAAAWDSSILSRSSAEYATETAKAICKYNCAAYLNGMFEFDRWLGAGHKLTDGEIESLSGRPVLQCGTDFWGTDFSRAKIENLAETAAYVCKYAGQPYDAISEAQEKQYHD